MTAAPAEVRVDAVRAVVDGVLRAVTLAVSGGLITAVADYGTPLPARDVVRWGSDVVVLPGLVDTHVHLDEPGHDDWEGFASGTRAAARGGITTLVDMPLDSAPVTTDVAALALKRSAAQGKCSVDVGFWAGVVPGSLDQLVPLHEAGALGFKCFLGDSGNSDFPPVDVATMTGAMRVLAPLGAPLLVHCEDATSLGEAPEPRGRSYAAFLASRPHRAEVTAVRAVVAAVRETRARAHVVHVSSAATLDVLAAAQSEGLPISAETCPHYLAFHDADIPDGATDFACCPPIRAAADREALWDGLRSGVLAMVVSDHSPCAAALKQRGSGDFGRALGGISSLQLGLAATWTEARRRGFDLVDLCRWMAQAPAQLAGLESKGRIAVGADADLCVFDPGASWVVDPARLHHKQTQTAYAGRALVGTVVETWLAGRPVGDSPAGRLR